MMQVYPVKFIAATLLMSLALAQDKVNPDAQLVQDFEKRVNDYLTLQKNIAKAFPVMKATSEPQVILDHQHELAKKLREARKGAHQGEIFTPDISKEFHRLLGFAHEGQNDTHIKKSLERSEPVRITLKVNDSYPSNIPLQSTPPTILMNLPKLPPELEYRIVNKTLVLRDSTANIVVDLIPNALP